MLPVIRINVVSTGEAPILRGPRFQCCRNCPDSRPPLQMLRPLSSSCSSRSGHGALLKCGDGGQGIPVPLPVSPASSPSGTTCRRRQPDPCCARCTSVLWPHRQAQPVLLRSLRPSPSLPLPLPFPFPFSGRPDSSDRCRFLFVIPVNTSMEGDRYLACDVGLQDVVLLILTHSTSPSSMST